MNAILLSLTFDCWRIRIFTFNHKGDRPERWGEQASRQTIAPSLTRGRANEAFLECHHIIWLAQGGEDTIANTVALCPNCHRKMHVLNRNADKQKLTKRAVGRADIAISAA